MTEEQIKFLNEGCSSIYYDESIEEDIVFGTKTSQRVTVKTIEALRFVISKLNDKNKIGYLNLKNLDFKIDDIKPFKKVGIISSDANLDLDLLNSINENFPDISDIYFKSASNEVFDNYEKVKFLVNIRETEIIRSDNKYLDYRDKFYLKKINYFDIIYPTKEEDIKELSLYCGEIINLRYDMDTHEVDGLFEFLELLKKNNIKVKNVIINLENKNYDFLEELKKIEESGTTVTLNYDGIAYSNIDDYYNMRCALNYYVELIKDANLSPVEQIMYAYDLTKSFDYKENDDDLSYSREIHKIIKDGKIVCVGFARLFGQILKELGLKISICNVFAGQDKEGDPNNIQWHFPKKTNHVRNLGIVDDEKYDIHGLFAFDATKDRNEKEDGLHTYKSFMVPLSEYYKAFPTCSYPYLFSSYLYDKTENLSFSKELKEQLKLFFKKDKVKDVVFGFEFQSYFNAPKLTAEQFKEIFRNVKKAEGYPEHMIEEELEKALKINGYESSENKKI